MGTFDLTKLSEEDPSVGEAKKICDQFGKTKTLVLQGHRTGGVEGGVCSAIVHAWIRDGVIGDVGKRRAIRKEFREDFNSMTAMAREHIDEQDSLAQYTWTPRKNAGTGADIRNDYWLVSRTVQKCPDVPEELTAYFYLSLDHMNAGRHAVGLKRGKLQKDSIRYFSFLDPNYFEVTHIRDLDGFLKSYCPSIFKKYRQWGLGYLSPTLAKPSSTPSKTQQPTSMREEEDFTALDDLLDQINFL